MSDLLRHISTSCFGASYLLAFGCELARTRWPSVPLRWVALGWAAVGLFTHSVFLAVHHPSPAAAYGATLAVAWVLAVFSLYGSLHAPRRAWAVFILPMVLGLVGLAAFAVSSADKTAVLGDKLWAAAHGVLVLLSAVGVCVGCIASVMYLIQADRLRRKLSPLGGMNLLSLERLEQMNRRAITLAFPLLTVGLLLGAVLLRQYHDLGENWWNLKVLGTVGLWVVFGLLLYLRYSAHASGRRLAWLTIAAFGLMLAVLLAAHPFAGETKPTEETGLLGSPVPLTPNPSPPGERGTGGGTAMNLRAIGCNFRTAAVELREKLAFDDAKQRAAVTALATGDGCEAVLLSTCNRVELYVSRPLGAPPFDAATASAFLSAVHGVPAEHIRPLLYEHADEHAVRHLSRVSASLDSLIVGEGQIAGQVKQAFELAQSLAATGPLLNTLFPHALRVAKRVRTETGIARGHVSVSSVAVDYVRQVFDHFHDKTVLVIGAGKMARLTLTHLRDLHPKRILVTNRSPAKAAEVAAGCGGLAVAWEQLDSALAEADIALSTTGAGEPIMPRARFDKLVRPKRHGHTLVVLDIAVPRDFDPLIHDGDRVFVFNIDDLTRVREQTLGKRRKHVTPAEAIVEAEVRRYADDWKRRKSGPVIKELFGEADRLRAEVLGPLLGKLNGKLTPQEKEAIEIAFRQFQNKLLHGPIAALK